MIKLKNYKKKIYIKYISDYVFFAKVVFFMIGQTWKMSKTLPEQDCLFPDFTRKCANYGNFENKTKHCNLSANTMFTTFTG